MRLTRKLSRNYAVSRSALAETILTTREEA